MTIADILPELLKLPTQVIGPGVTIVAFRHKNRTLLRTVLKMLGLWDDVVEDLEEIKGLAGGAGGIGMYFGPELQDPPLEFGCVVITEFCARSLVNCRAVLLVADSAVDGAPEAMKNLCKETAKTFHQALMAKHPHCDTYVKNL
jgi:hypothetical protein